MNQSDPSKQTAFLYDAFISYRHVDRDRQWAEWLIEALESYRVPKALQAMGHPPRLRKVFRDEDEMPASGDLNDQIKQALAASRYLIVVCSPYTPRSKWVEREIEIFKELGRGDHVLALLTEGEPYDAFPTALLERHRVVEKPDGTKEIVRENSEPLAADVRPRKGVAEAAIKQQALLRLVAAMFGVSYDALRQREQERRRRVRNVGIAASLTVVMACAIGAGGYWEYARPKTAYYRAITWRWGLPEGLGRIDAATRARRETSYAIVTERGRLAEIRLENSAGLLRHPLFESEAIAKCRVDYRRDGEIDRLTCFDRWDRYDHHTRYKREGNRLIEAVERGNAPLTQLASERLLAGQQATGQIEGRERSEITGMANTFDANGFVVEQRYFDPWGTPRQDADGAIGARFANSSQGLVLQRTKIAADGRDLIGKTGVAAVAFAYDAHGRRTSETLLGPDGKSIAGPGGTAGSAFAYDQWGNETATSTLGVDGQLVIGVDGYSRNETSYDVRGNQVEVRYFDASGNPVEHKRGGCARVTNTVDARGNRLDRRCFDVEGKPTLGKDRFHRYTYTYDARDRFTEWAYFGVDGNPVLHKDGMARLTFVYDTKGNIAEKSYFGVDGKPVAIYNGFAKLIQKYDDRKNIVDESFFGVGGEPILHRRDGAARVTLSYDARGNLTDMAHYGTDDKPILNRWGFARREVTYDSRGNVLRWHHFGVDSKPIIGWEGFASVTNTYDERGNRTGSAYFGLNGEPVVHREGCASFLRQFDERGNRTVSSCFGVDGQPKLSNDQCAVLRREYDARGNLTSVACFGVDGKPALQKLGIARTTSRFDGRGNLLDRAFFGIDGQPILHREGGSAGYKYVYNVRGNRIETQHFGVDGKPIMNAFGYARSTATFDARGNLTVEAFFGFDGRLVMQRGAFAKVESTFNERDEIIAARFFDAEGREVPREIAVSAVRPGSVGQRAGLQVSDRLIAYDAQPVVAVVQLRNLTTNAGFGVPHKLTVKRGGETLELQVQAGELGITMLVVAPGEVVQARPVAQSPERLDDFP